MGKALKLVACWAFQKTNWEMEISLQDSSQGMLLGFTPVQGGVG